MKSIGSHPFPPIKSVSISSPAAAAARIGSPQSWRSAAVIRSARGSTVCGNWVGPVDQLTWEGGWARANLLPASDRPARNLTLFTIPRLLGVVVLLLVAVVLISPLWQREQLLESTLAELRRLRVEAQQVEEVRSALAQAREGSIAVLRQKLEQPRMTDMLRELTRSLPDDTWIQSLEVRDGEVQLRGESSQATALIELLEREPGVEGVAFRSPVTQVARTGTERFNVAFRYRGVATP